MVVMAFGFFRSLMEGIGSGIGHLPVWSRLLVLGDDPFERTGQRQQSKRVDDVHIQKIVE